MAIKKAFEPLFAVLEANKGKKVSDILANLTDLASAKSGGGRGGEPKAKFDDKGVVTHVFCYYHQAWEEVSKVAYGNNKTAKTGLVNMCKEGNSAWTAREKKAKLYQTDRTAEQLKLALAGKLNTAQAEAYDKVTATEVAKIKSEILPLGTKVAKPAA